MGSVLIKAADAGKDQAIPLLQALMLRFLTSIPPGKVRFTIIDPVGLGENFAAFMHLADYDELLVTSRIWTEPPHIEQRLTDLTEHMENVIQKYLRNEFETIEEYNAMAGEVAEPFRVLVVANFPANFSETAAAAAGQHRQQRRPLRRLRPDHRSTPSCQLPSGFQLKDLEPHCVNFVWKDGKLSWSDAATSASSRWRSTRRPTRDVLPQILHDVGDAAKRRQPRRGPVRVHRARRPTSTGRATAAAASTCRSAAPAPPSSSTSSSARAPRSTSSIAGKTGSGKSTLLHALITNAALRYSPDEVELYLIDFKKGVEFKVYAAHRAAARPGHRRRERARVRPERAPAARRRAEAPRRPVPRRRRPGPQRLSARPGPTTPMPRILLIVDEFQEFFVEDDKIAQEVVAAARPPGPPRPCLRHPRHPRLADARRGLLAGPEHARPDGRPHRACSAARPTPT